LTYDDAITALSKDAVKLVKNHQTIGLGSGRSATAFVKSLSSLVKNDYDVELSVFSESDPEKYDPKNKAKAARPFKPAILIE